MRRNGVGWAAVLAALTLLLAGCSSGSTSGAASGTSAPRPAGDDPPPVSLSFIQQRIDEGTRRAQLRVVNRADRDITVTRIGLDWPGYGTFTEEHVTSFQPGQTIDLHLTLPAPSCGDVRRPAVGVVTLDDGSVVRKRLDSSGQRFLRRVWSRACAEEYVDEQVELDYTGPWRHVGTGRTSSLHGSIRLVRRAAQQDVMLVDLRGSVLFGVELLEPSLLPAGRPDGAFPIRLFPARCDAHALGQSTQTFVFRATVRVGDAPARTVVAAPDRAARARALEFLFDACR